MPRAKQSSNIKSVKKEKDKNTELRSVKGMRDLIGGEWFSYQGFFEKAAEIAVYYGFKPIETPILESAELFTRGIGNETDIVGKEMYTLRTKGGVKLALRPEGTAAVMRAYFEHGMQAEPQPVMLYYAGPFFRHENPQRGRWREFYQFGLEILGTAKSIADALIIKLTILILTEANLKNLTVKINSIGDAECRPAFRRDLLVYYKKHTREICADCRERLKTNPLRVLDCKNPKCQPVKAEAPDSISYLCQTCRAHFKEVLEYLDMMGVVYEMDKTLVRGLDYYSHTVFEVATSEAEEPAKTKPADDSEVGKKTANQTAGQAELAGDGDQVKKTLALAGGGRYNYLARALKTKKDVSAMGMSIGVDRVVSLTAGARLSPRIIKKPKVFFIQLSFEAKLKSFEVIEILRQAKVPIAQSLSKDSLSAQLSMAEKIRAPYAIILGQKEALENTVIVRHLESRSQDTVPVKDLAAYIKENVK